MSAALDAPSTTTASHRRATASSAAALRKLKVCLIGPYQSGKSTIIRQLTEHTFTEQPRVTVGVEFHDWKAPPLATSSSTTAGAATTPQPSADGGTSPALPGGTTTGASANSTTNGTASGGAEVTMQIWDVAGQQRSSFLNKQYYRHAVATVLVTSVMEMSSAAVTDVDLWVTDFRSKVSPPVGYLPDDLPIVLVLNKCDLLEGRSAADIADIKEKWSRFAETKRFVRTFFITAKEYSQVEDVFVWVLQHCLINVPAGAPSPPVGSPAPRVLQPVNPAGTPVVKDKCPC